MRELKFRVWDKERKEIFVAQSINRSGCATILLKNQDILILPKKQIEIMQYTGLKDKNGKEIYEGYIVERRKLISAREMAVPGWGKDHTEIRRAVIVYKHGMFYGRSITAGINTNYSWDELEADFEIIGNIHENTELLEEEE